ncbi:hypothetical protein [Sphingomonas sp. TREG-RG-20F-R18-01]|uniref:hypothetical protein n=1 Tax=Sphingomonas sp. TREG-RG-20F-R18-01 TaxID=2914982 RepID=UPI001F57A504|nr:hypothetical protein [Sphingomonas sp. TREG-RG-20F-R18-01]
MTTRNSSYDNVDGWGHPAFEVLDDYTMAVLLAGVTPPLADPMHVLLADNQNLPIYQVVGLDANKKLVKAVFGSVQAIGVMSRSAVSGAGNTTVKGNVYYSGCFNIDEKSVLVWDASYDTETKKAQAFIGAPTPCQIVARRRLAPTS